ncbi:MAG: RHS repeat-associated core domain-containing protein, partial [Chitinophaga rupis]
PYPAVTLEPGAIGSEQLYYNITNDGAHVIATGGLGWWPSPSGTYPNNNGVTNPGNPDPNGNSAWAYKLNGQTGDKFGLGITLKVMAGDKITILGKSVWHNTGAAAGSFKISSVLSSFLNAFAGTSAVVAGGHGAVTGAALNGATATTSLLSPMLDNTPGQSSPSTVPKAAINWILFNDQFVPVSIGTDLVSPTADVMYPHSRLNMPMAANGYLYVYCSNESAIDVYFDNLQVLDTRGPILEETHYYPYGMAMAGISDKAWNKLPNLNHFNGNELQTQEFNDGTGLNTYDFNARHYDQQLGRFLQVDPKSAAAGQEGMSPYQMGYNDPATFSDPNGDCPICVIIVAAVVSAYAGGVMADINHTSVWAGIGKGALVGAVGGGLGEALAGAFTAWGMVGSGLANGAITGTVTGGLDAALSGKNVLKGMLTGGISGGLMGGVSGLMQRLSLGNPSSQTVGSPDDFDTGDSFKDDNDLDDYIIKNVGKDGNGVNSIDRAFNTDVRLAADDHLPSGY